MAAQTPWLALRGEYAARNGAAIGVGCVLFAAGGTASAWLDRLRAAPWCAGLVPDAADLAQSGGAARGGRALEKSGLAAAVPAAWIAAIATTGAADTPSRAGLHDLAAALRGRHDPLGRRLGVVVTVDETGGAMPESEAAALRRLGAFVVRGGNAAAQGDHLHHFVPRCIIQPPEGRLICADFADHARIWRPGGAARLYGLPFGAAAAWAGVPDGRAASLGFHIRRDAPGALRAMDACASAIAARFPAPDHGLLFTDTARLDRRTGTADLLLMESNIVQGCNA